MTDFSSTVRSPAPGLTKVGQLFFAIATVAFGILNFIYGDFVMGRAPVWPELVGGKYVWAYASGSIFICSGVAMAAGIKPRLATLVVAILVLIWALMRHVFALNFQWGAEITWFGKALFLCGGAFAVAGSFPKESGSIANKFPGFINATSLFIYIGRFAMGIFLIICGIEHFMFVDFVKSLVPAWIPGQTFWTYFAGVALIAGGAGLMINPVARLAAILSGLMVFVWFIILHIPRAVVSAGDGNEWISVFEALAVSGICFVSSSLRQN